MEDCVERMINELPMKISKSDMYLTPSGNNIFEHFNRKRLGKNKLKIPMLQ